jgi:predicted nuclease of predicted toxin-antitoxin system
MKSKKQSGASLKSKLLDPIEIFIDRALGRRIAEPLKKAGAIVHLHDDHFDQGVDDEVWLTEVGRRGWVVITKDQRIRYRAIEREALINAGVRAFIFMSGNVAFSDMAEIIAKTLPRIEKFIRINKPPFIAGIYRDASIRRIL